MTKHIAQTSVEYTDGWLELMLKKPDSVNQLARVTTAVDPITNRITAQVYTDDGRGNGLMMFEIALD